MNVIGGCFIGYGQGGGAPTGIAIDHNGDVFVVYRTSSGGKIVEYTGGLSGCNGTTLHVTVNAPGGMVMDKHNNLIVCSISDYAVEIIKPPYTNISGTLASGFENPYFVTINKKNNLVYVGNAGLDVFVLSYPGGKTVADLGSKEGVSGAEGAVDGENFVP